MNILNDRIQIVALTIKVARRKIPRRKDMMPHSAVMLEISFASLACGYCDRPLIQGTCSRFTQRHAIVSS